MTPPPSSPTIEDGCYHDKRMNGIYGNTALSLNLAVAGSTALLLFPNTRTPTGGWGGYINYGSHASAHVPAERHLSASDCASFPALRSKPAADRGHFPTFTFAAYYKWNWETFNQE